MVENSLFDYRIYALALGSFYVYWFYFYVGETMKIKAEGENRIGYVTSEQIISYIKAMLAFYATTTTDMLYSSHEHCSKHYCTTNVCRTFCEGFT